MIQCLFNEQLILGLVMFNVKSKTSSKGLRSPLIVPKDLECFAHSFDYKNAHGLFLGNISTENESNQRAQFSQTRSMAKLLLGQGKSALEPTEEALEKTKRAAKAFFALSYKMITEKNTKFPLAGCNKCLGMVVLPTTSIVTIAISQDKDPRKDILLRQSMAHFLNELNETTKEWTFELAYIPTKAQYLMPRTLFMRTPHTAPQEWVSPHTRCIEVALMSALNKAGLFIKFTSADIGTMAYGGTLWASPDGADAIPPFEGALRNIKYRVKTPLEVKLTDSMSGWIDIWEPCDEHCKQYKYEMLAIGAAGGPATSFMEPRAEWEAPKKN